MVKKLTVCAVALLPFVTAFGDDGQSCQPLKFTEEQRQERKEHLNTRLPAINDATVLLGVDSLGRVAVAIDSDNDGFADYCRLFTSSERLDGPWSRTLVNARVKEWNGALLIESRTDNYAMSVAATDARLPRINRNIERTGETFVAGDGVELVRVSADAPTQALADMTHGDVTTWPELFWYDLLDPASTFNNCGAAQADCFAGGIPSNSCSMNVEMPPFNCSVSGCASETTTTLPDGSVKTDITFACCAITGSPLGCRCRSCYTITGGSGTN